jgi:hypothetical protein
VLGPQDVGHRVVVRRVVGRRDGRPLMTDVLGILTSLTDSQLTIDTESTGPLTIDRAAVVAAKRVPPRAPRRIVRRPGGGPGTGSHR